MAENRTCEEAHQAALEAARASAAALKIKRSPLVEELVRQGKNIPDCAQAKMQEITRAFIEKMTQMKAAAEQQAASGKQPVKAAKSLEDVLAEAQQATERALTAARELEAAKEALKPSGK